MTDLLTFALPFFLIFAIVYGALEISGVFKKNKAVNAIIALVIGAFAVTSEQVVALTFTFMPYAALLFIVVFILGFVLSPFKGKEEERDYSLMVIIVALIILFLASQGQEMLTDMFPALSGSGESIFTLVGLLLIVVIIFAGYQHSKGESAKKK